MRIFRLRLLLSLSLSTVAVWVTCNAAYYPGSTEGSTSWELLLNDADVQKELRLTPEQAKKAQQACRAVRAKVLNKYRSYQAPDATTASTKAGEIMQQIYQDTDPSLAGALTEEQFKRLKEIDRQQRGLLAKGTRTVLQLTAEQVRQLEKLRTDRKRDVQSAYRKLGLDRTAKIAAWQKLYKTYLPEELKVMTDEQRKLWQELTGTPFQHLKLSESNGVDPKIKVYVPPPRPAYP